MQKQTTLCTMVFLLNDHIADDHSSTYKINDPDLHDDKWEYLISQHETIIVLPTLI